MRVKNKPTASALATAPSGTGRTVLIYVLLAGITLVSLGQVCRNKFNCLDDPIYITDNQYVLTGLTLRNIDWAFTTLHNGFWHPLTWVSLQMDATPFSVPLSPWRFFLTNLVLHLANVLLLFHVLARMTGAPIRSALVAALFAVHPMRVESVAWATERKDVLFAFFWLIALWAYIHYAARPSLGRYGAVFLAMALSLMAKPMAVTLPCVFLLLDFWPLRRLRMAGTTSAEPPRYPEASARGLIVEKIPLLALSLIFAIVTLIAQVPVMGEQAFSVERRLAHVPIYYGWYFWKSLVPYPVALYYRYPASEGLWLLVLAGMLVLAAGGLIAWRSRHRQPAILIGWLWFLGMLVPVIFLNVADRFTYLPHIGLFIALVWGLAELAPAKSSPGACLACLAPVLVCWMCLTWVQTNYWRNSIVLWQRCVAVTDSARAHMNLGNTLSYNDMDAAIRSYQKALEIDPAFAEGHYNLGLALYSKRDLNGAIREYRTVLDIDPNSALAHGNLGIALRDQKDLDQAIVHLRKAVAIDPDSFLSNYNLGLALYDKGNVDEAIKLYRRALDINPNSSFAHGNLGSALSAKKDLDGAITQFQIAVNIDPDSAGNNFNLGFALHEKRIMDGAMKYYQKALVIDPSFALAHYHLGRVYYQMQTKLELAIKHFRMAVDNDPNLAPAHFDLGVALHDRNDLVGAVALCRKACQLDDKYSAMFRLEVSHWLGDNLEVVRRSLKDGLTRDTAAAVDRITHCQKTPDLSSVREPKALAALPAEDQKLWRKLWSDADELLKQIRASQASKPPG